MMRTPIATATLLALSACGGSPEQTVKGQGGAETPAAEIDCSSAKPQSAPAGAPADDVLGVRSGMSLADARLLIKCTNKAFRFEESRDGFRLPEMPDGSFATTRLVARRGEIAGCDPKDPSTMKTCLDENPNFERIDETVVVHLTGLPGREKVFAVARELRYPEGGEAATEAIAKDLTAKYGAEPSIENSYGSTARLNWVFDGQGRRLSPANPDLADCARAVGAGESAPSQLRPGCRLTVNAWIEGKSDSPQLARSFGAVAVDQQAALDALDQAKAEINAARGRAQQQEVERAKARSGGTTL